MNSPITYSDSLETIDLESEAHTDENLEQSFDTILHTTFEDYGTAVRAVHAKAHGILEGTFTVHGGLAPELAQGMFANAGEHRAWLRFSTNAGDLLDDAIALPRGLAVKVENIDGERLPGASGSSQDFVMVNAPVFNVSTAEKFAGMLRLLAKTTDVGQGAKKALSAVLQTLNSALGAVGVKTPVLAGLGGAPQVDPLGETYYSITPFRYGDYVAKFRLRPVSASLTALTGMKIDLDGNPDGIRAHVRAEMAAIEGEWAFEVQLARDIERQPIEDASALWKEDEAPFAQVATLRCAPQDSWAAGQVELVDRSMAFSPWTGLVAHRPLGNLNRARRQAYRHSSDFRASANHCPILEP
jgi:hypothetical protein